MSNQQFQERDGPPTALREITADALEVSNMFGTPKPRSASFADVGSDSSERARLREDLHVEVVVRTEDIRITGCRSFGRGCTASTFIGDVLVLLAMARRVAKAKTGTSSLLGAAFGVTVSAREATYRIAGLIGCEGEHASFRM